MLVQRLRTPVRAAVGLCALVAVAGVAEAATFTVTKTADTADGACDADCSLREAIVAANTTPEADEIVLPVIGATPTAYTLTIPTTALPGVDPLTGDLDVFGDVTVTGAGADAVILDGAGSDNRAFTISSAPPAGPGSLSTPATIFVTLSGFTIRNFTAPTSQDGGAILNVGADLTLMDMAIRENGAFRGGGVAVTSDAAVTALRTLFEANTATFGGAVSVSLSASATFQDCVVRMNEALVAGGLDKTSAEGALTLERTWVDANRTTGGGGGGMRATGGTLAIMDSAFTNNNAFASGGGAFVLNTVATISNSTFADNLTTSGAQVGGGLAFNAIDGGSLTVTHTTFAGNYAMPTSEQVSTGGTPPGQAVFRNTLVAHANEGGGAPLCAGSITSEGGNLSEDASCGFSLPEDRENVAPILGPLADNGGPTPTRALLAGSAGIGLGVADYCLPTDQRGVARDAACDAGAFEFTGGGCPADLPAVRAELQSAVDAVAGDAGETVVCLIGLTVD